MSDNQSDNSGPWGVGKVVLPESTHATPPDVRVSPLPEIPPPKRDEIEALQDKVKYLEAQLSFNRGYMTALEERLSRAELAISKLDHRTGGLVRMGGSAGGVGY